MNQYRYTLIAMMLALLYSGAASAFGCEFQTGSAAINMQMPVQGMNITVGPDTPDGTVIYRQYYKPAGRMEVACHDNTTSYRPVLNYTYSQTPRPISGYNSGPYAGKIYQTNIPGVGVAVFRGTGTGAPVMPFTQYSWPEPDTASSRVWVAQGGFDFDVVFVKIGAIQPGSLTGASLPTISIYFNAQNITPIRVVQASFSGALNIVSRSCTTPNVTVNMGSYGVEQFQNTGASTSWKDASIILTNCPRFYGMLVDGRNTYYSDNGSSGLGNFSANALSLTVRPNTPVIDTANGIFSLQTGSGTASGVGIQLAQGKTSGGTISLPASLTR